MRRSLIIVGLSAVAAVGILGGRQLALARSQPVVSGGHSFTIKGQAAGLVPGQPTTLRLTVANPNAQSMRLTAASATAQAASRSCPASLLTIKPYAGTPQVVVPAHGQANVDLSITLSTQASTACRRVSFPLNYAGRADQWH